MERIACILCGVEDERAILPRNDPRHVVCRRCGLVYRNPRPSEADTRDFYVAGFWEMKGMVELTVGHSPRDAIARGRAVVEWVESFLGAGDFAIEVGCGHGEIISQVKSRFGCEVLGIEPSRVQAEVARQRFSIDVLNADIEGADLHGRKAKLVILSHVVEHLSDPRRSLAACREWLSDNGFMFVEVPNIRRPNPTKRLTRWLSKEHLYYFSPQTLRRVVEDAGFEIVRLQEDIFVRLLAKRAHTAVRSAPALENEYPSVIRALVEHELRYWPWYVAQKVQSLILPHKAASRGEQRRVE